MRSCGRRVGGFSPQFTEPSPFARFVERDCARTSATNFVPRTIDVA